MMDRKKVCHLTSVHSRSDVRLFYKECLSLAEFFNVYLIVADGKGEEIYGKIRIIDVGKAKNRISRFFFTTRKIYKKAIEIDAELYHFHDPELIFVGSMISISGKLVIYDIHEDVPRQILAKPYLNTLLKKVISFIVEQIENRICSRFSTLICATQHINSRFLPINSKSFNINNFPILQEFMEISTVWNHKQNSICYVGGISKERGIFELIESLNYSNCILHLAGEFESQGLYDEIRKKEGWKKVVYHGIVGRKEIIGILAISKIGIVTLRYTPNHSDSLPVKMFEYMGAGIPIIASNFPAWDRILKENNCGICVDPMKPQAIAKEINYLLENPAVAEEMGKNGRLAIKEKFNWEHEKMKLISIYSQLLE